MKKSERNWLIFLGLIVALSIPYFISGWNGEPEYDELGLRIDSEDQIARLTLSRNTLPDLQLDLLDSDKEAFSGSSRNLFVYGESSSVEDIEPREETMEDDAPGEDPYDVPVVDEAVEENPKPAQRRLAGYDYVGLHIGTRGKAAVFFWRGRTFVGYVGSTVNEAFEIKEIERNYVLIHVLNGDFEQRMKLKSPAKGATGGSQ